MIFKIEPFIKSSLLRFFQALTLTGRLNPAWPFCSALAIAFFFCSPAWPEKVTAPVRLDIFVTLANSVVYDLGEGVKLRIPMVPMGLTPESLKEIKQPIAWEMPLFNVLIFTYS